MGDFRRGWNEGFEGFEESRIDEIAYEMAV